MKIMKLLFIDKTVPNRNILIDNISKTVILVDKKESLNDIDYLNIEQIGFIWKNEWRKNNKPFFPRFVDYNSKKQEIYKKISEIVKNYPNLKYVDLITCDLTENSEWDNEFKNLRENTNAEIRYSINKTLNTKWILEVGKVSILDEYYDGNDIQYNQDLSLSPIQTLDFFIIKSPLVTLDRTVLTFNDNITINVDEYDSIKIGDHTVIAWSPILIEDTVKIIDGCGKTIKFINNLSNNPIASLFYIPSTTNLEIRNLIIDSDNNDTGYAFDGIVHSDSQNPVNNVTVKNCGVYNLYPSINNGLIFGNYAASNNEDSIRTCRVLAVECYTHGNMSITTDNNSGFIFGANAANNISGNGNCVAIAIACYTTGNIYCANNNGGFIFGVNAANNISGNGKCVASAVACYTTGKISCISNIGSCIFGVYAANNYGGSSSSSSSCSAYATSCYTMGNILCISDNYGSFIFGQYASLNYGSTNTSTCTSLASACYTIGSIECDINYGGFIFGEYAASNYYNHVNNYGTYKSIAKSCYTTGNIKCVSNNGGFIFGNYAASNTHGNDHGTYIALTIACYTNGDIICDNNYGGFIFGSWAAYHNSMYSTCITKAIACYTTGNINCKNDNYGGFIFGGYAAYNNNRYNFIGSALSVACYTTGKIICNNNLGNLIFGITNNDIYIISVKDCYILYNDIWYNMNENAIPHTEFDLSKIDTTFFRYNNNSDLTQQLQLRFFTALPIHYHLINKTVLRDWSYYEQEIAKISHNDLWYINCNNFLNISCIDDIKILLKNVNDCDKSIDENYPSYSVLSPLLLNDSNINDIIYDSDNNTYQQFYNGMILNEMTYKVSSQFPIIAEFCDKTELIDPLKNYYNINYRDASNLWMKIIPTTNSLITSTINISKTRLINYNSKKIKTNIDIPCLEIDYLCNF